MGFYTKKVKEYKMVADELYKRYRTHALFLLNKVISHKVNNPIQERQNIINTLEREYNTKINMQIIDSIDKELFNNFYWSGSNKNG